MQDFCEGWIRGDVELWKIGRGRIRKGMLIQRPTPHWNPLKSIEQDEAEQQKRVNALIYVLKYIINAAGFNLLNRIELKDRKTGREYRWWTLAFLYLARSCPIAAFTIF